MNDNYEISLRGLAMMSAIESGLLPKNDDGWDTSAFDTFWNTFEALIQGAALAEKMAG